MHEPRRLWNRNFSLLWQGHLVSALGTQLSQVILVLWLYQATDSSASIGLLLMLTSIPGVLLGPLAGALCDRLSRKAILVASDALQGLLCLGLAGLMWAGAGAPSLLIAVFAVNVLAAVIDVLFYAAATAAAPDLVPADKVEAANSLTSSAHEMAKLAGQGAGGLLFAVVAVPVVIAIDGLTYLYSALSECFLGLPPALRDRHGRASIRAVLRRTVEDVQEGFRFVAGSTGRWQLLGIVGLLNLFIVPFFVVIPEFVGKELKASEAWYGYATAAMGVGALVGALMAGAVRLQGRDRGVALMAALPLVGVLMVLSGCATSGWALVACSMGLGAVFGFANVPIRTLLQMTTPRHLRGRVFGLQQMLVGGLTPLGYGLCSLGVAWLRSHPGVLPPSLGSPPRS